MQVSDYLSLITSEHANKPKFVAMVTALITPLVESQTLLQQLVTTFDIDTAVGVQLDAVGEWIGRSRFVIIPLTGTWFSFDESAVGFDEGVWYSPFDSLTSLTTLNDDVYRLLLKAKIIMNRWDGTIAVAASALTELFGSNPNTVISILDNQDMSMTVGISGEVPPQIVLSLLQGGYVPIVPEGVGISYAITSVNGAPLFGFDVQNLTISGFDRGAWSGIPGTGPGLVSGFTLVAYTGTSATFSWLAPGLGGPYTYELQFQEGTGTSFWNSTTPISGTTTSITLLANTQYSFQVFAIGATGPGAPSPVITITPPAGSLPPATFLVMSAVATAVQSNTFHASASLQVLHPLGFATSP